MRINEQKVEICVRERESFRKGVGLGAGRKICVLYFLCVNISANLFH